MKEEEKRRKKEEEERKKEEEKQRKEEEKRRKEEEKQRKEEEKRRKKEEEKRAKEEEAERKREEKRMKEEDKRRKEEERLKKEEEKRKREEEKLLKEQEKKNVGEGQKPKEECQRNVVGESQDTNLKETSEQVLSADLANNINSKDSNKAIECDKVMRHNIDKSADLMKKDDSLENIESEINKGSHNNFRNGTYSSDNMKESKQDTTKSKNSNEARDFVSKSGKLEEIIGNVDRIEKDLAARAKLGSSNEIQEVRSPRIPHPPLSPKKKQQDHNKDVRKR